MRSGNCDSRSSSAFLCIGNSGNVDLDKHTRKKCFIRDLFASEERLLSLADFNDSVLSLGINSRNLGCNDLLIVSLKLLTQSAMLGLADTLSDNMLALIGCNSADLFCLKLNFNNVSDHSCRLILLSLFNGQILIGINHLGDNVLSYKNSHCLFLGVKLAENDVLVVVVTLNCRDERLLNTLAKYVHRYSFFFFKHFERHKKLFVYHCSSPPKSSSLT